MDAHQENDAATAEQATDTRKEVASNLGKAAALGGLGGALLALVTAPDFIAVGIIGGALTVAAIRVAFLMAPGSASDEIHQDRS